MCWSARHSQIAFDKSAFVEQCGRISSAGGWYKWQIGGVADQRSAQSCRYLPLLDPAAQSPHRMIAVGGSTPLYSLPDSNGWLSRNRGGLFSPPCAEPGAQRTLERTIVKRWSRSPRAVGVGARQNRPAFRCSHCRNHHDSATVPVAVRGSTRTRSGTQNRDQTDDPTSTPI